MTNAGDEVHLFDLDGVLTRVDTMSALVRGRLLARPWTALPALLLVLVASLARPHGRVRPAAHRGLVRIALLGCARYRYDDIAERLAQTLATGGAPIVDGVRRLHQCQAGGAQVVVITASERALAEAYLRNVGVVGVALLASELEERVGGLALRPHNIGPAKVSAAVQAGIPLDRATLYTDSASDAPLAAVVLRTVAVNASPRDLDELAEVAKRCELVEWR